MVNGTKMFEISNLISADQSGIKFEVQIGVGAGKI